MKNGGLILWHAIVYLRRNFQDLLADVKTPHERRLGEPFTGPAIPFGAMVECHPISAKGQSRLHQFFKKMFYRVYMHCSRGEFGKEI